MKNIFKLLIYRYRIPRVTQKMQCFFQFRSLEEFYILLHCEKYILLFCNTLVGLIKRLRFFIDKFYDILCFDRENEGYNQKKSKLAQIFY